MNKKVKYSLGLGAIVFGIGIMFIQTTLLGAGVFLISIPSGLSLIMSSIPLK